MFELTLTVNGEERVVDVEPTKPLVDVLRDDLELKGTKRSCSSGVCGACTVRIDGEARKSCLHFAGSVEGASVETVEGLAQDDELHPVQEAFLEEFSFQCGFCTAGFLLSTVSLLERSPNPTADEIKDALRGNLCRCTGYVSIVEGVRNAAEKMDATDERTADRNDWPTADEQPGN